MELREHTCAHKGCGVTFGLTDGFEMRRKEDHGAFYCPNGHIMSYPGETAEQKLSRAESSLEWERGEKEKLRREVQRLKKVAKK